MYQFVIRDPIQLLGQLSLLFATWDKWHIRSLWEPLACVPERLFVFPTALDGGIYAHKPCLIGALRPLQQ